MEGHGQSHLIACPGSAAAARLAGSRHAKSLPTVSHWYVAAGLGLSSQITSLSNIGGQGPAPIGTHLGLAPSGTYDMAGNVKEWTVNASAENQNRFTLGGSWNDLSYMFQQVDARACLRARPNLRIPLRPLRGAHS
jgi:formylglycine-generating enzyme required for sulfatase activity